MKRFVIVAAAIAVFAVALSAERAAAIPPFKKEFETRYVKDGSPLATAVEQAKCNVCHKGTSTKEFNDYGLALEKMLDKATDAKDAEKIQKVLETVESQPSKPGDKSAPTFGDLLKAGKLPADAS